MKFLTIAGARPNFVKIAPIMRELRRRPGVQSPLVHTGQHYDDVMSDSFFRDLDIPAPDVNLHVGRGTPTTQTAQIMERLAEVLQRERPDVVIVVGDVTSTVAAALATVQHDIRLAHVEAGLRSFDRSMPEEINRVVTDALADFLFVTEESGRHNLLAEGMSPGKIHFVGNVMIDALDMFRPQWERSDVRGRLGIGEGRPYGVVTLHRPGNIDDPRRLADLVGALQSLADDLPLVLPMHPRLAAQLERRNTPRLTVAARGERLPERGLVGIAPLGYIDFVGLVSRARLVLTDSGGVQEETTVLRVPCLTLRSSTERPVTVTHGTNHVIGTDASAIRREGFKALSSPRLPSERPPLWDGLTAPRIVDILLGSLRVQRWAA